jgi:hypothetical protein
LILLMKDPRRAVRDAAMNVKQAKPD